MLAEERKKAKPGHLPCPDDADMHLPSRLSQVLHGPRHHQLHSRTGDRHRALSNLGSCPHELADPNSGIQHLRDDLSARARHRLLVSLLALGDAVGMARLHLRQDLSLAEHQRVQTGTDLEEVIDGIVAGEGKQVWIQLLSREPRLLPQECVDALNGRVLLQLRRGEVKLEAVAGGEHGRLRHNIAVGGSGELDQVLRVLVPLRFSHCQLLADLYRRAVVAQPDDVHLHHGLDTLRALLTRLGIDLALNLAVCSIEVLPELRLSNGKSRISKTFDGIHQRSQQGINLAENSAKFGLSERPHCFDHLSQLPAPEQLRLVLESANLWHKLLHADLGIVEAFLWDG
mmetsp:Transcript_36511/g.85524  ORF Transcript_36511/g.85524 Transcript_36511/m.85524 type:complete len:343 (+) Transcript_36511:786-1814(+)